MGMLRRLHAFIRSSILLATENIVTDPAAASATSLASLLKSCVWILISFLL